MKENILEYKGYHTKVEYIAENDCLYGKIEGINDLVTFEAHDLKSVKKEFHDAVDDYLAFCEEIGQEPQKEYKGLFNVRTARHAPSDLSRTAIRIAGTAARAREGGGVSK
jgi:predicted HicB family RNase H-like nuclease